MATETGSDQGLRLAEVVAALSLATDLGLGQPMEHVIRSCLISLRIGERIGLEESERATVYHVALLAWVGCTADSHELARWFGDDIEFRAGTYEVDLAGLPGFAYMLRNAGKGSLYGRVTRSAGLVVTGGRSLMDLLMEHCRATGVLAERLGLGEDVTGPLQHNFARWDGKGFPPEVKGDALALPMRIVHLAEIAEVAHRSGGSETAARISRERAGTQFDPELAALFEAHAADLLRGLDEASSWDEVIASEPSLQKILTEPEIDNALEAIADFTDLKSPFLAGHSRGVAELAAEAGRRAGLEEAAVKRLYRAGLIHDLGRAGISNSIWDAPRRLTAHEWEKVRLHPYYTERMMSQPAPLRPIARLAAAHHERLDGSGYHRGVPGASLDRESRILAAADSYRAMTEDRPHRPSHDPERAVALLRHEVRAGRLDPDAVDAVCAAAGQRVSKRRSFPAGLTAREVEVLSHMTRGSSNREIARTLGISQKTVGHHADHIFTKLGISTRTEAALFAMRHGLVDPPEPR